MCIRDSYSTMTELCAALEAFLSTRIGPSELRAQARAALGRTLDEGTKARARRLAHAEAALQRRAAQAATENVAPPRSVRPSRTRWPVVVLSLIHI